MLVGNRSSGAVTAVIDALTVPELNTAACTSPVLSGAALMCLRAWAAADRPSALLRGAAETFLRNCGSAACAARSLQENVLCAKYTACAAHIDVEVWGVIWYHYR